MGNSRSNYFKEQFVRKQFANVEAGNDNLLGSFNVIRFQGQVPTTSLVKVLDTRVYDEYTDVAEAIRKLKQEHPQMATILFVTENAQNPELYNVAFEYGDPLKTYISTEALLWSYLEQIVEGLIFLEGQGYHYPNVSKQYIIATAKNTVKLLNPYTFSNFMKEILQIYLNPQNPMSNRRAYFVDNIARNIKELGITLATLVSNCNEYQLKTDTAYVNKVINSIGAKFSKSLVLLLQSLILNSGQLASFKDVKQLILSLKGGVPGDLQPPNATSAVGPQVGQVTPMPKQNMPGVGMYPLMSPNSQPQPVKQEQSSSFKNPVVSDERKAKIFDDKPPANKITSLRGPSDFQLSQQQAFQTDHGSLKKITTQQFVEQPVSAAAQPPLIDSSLMPQQPKQVPASAALNQSTAPLSQSQVQPVTLAESQLSQSNLQNSWVAQQPTPNGEVTNIPRTRSVPMNPLMMGVQNKQPTTPPAQQGPQMSSIQLVSPGGPLQPLAAPQVKQQPPSLTNSQIQQLQPQSQLPPAQFPQPTSQFPQSVPGPQQFAQPPSTLSPGSLQNTTVSPIQSPHKPANPEERERVNSVPNGPAPSMFNDGQSIRKGSLNAEPIIHGNDKLNFMFVNSPDPMNVNITSYFQRRESLGAGLADVPLPQRHDDFFNDEVAEQMMAEAKGLQGEQEALSGVQQAPPVPQVADFGKRTEVANEQKQGPIPTPQPFIQSPQLQAQPQPQPQLQPQPQPQPPLQPQPQPQPQPQLQPPLQPQPQPPLQPSQLQAKPQAPQKMIVKMHIKWMSEEQRHQKIIEYDDNTTEEVPFTEEEKTKFVIKTPKQPVSVPLQQPTIQSQPQQPQFVQPKAANLTSTPSIPQSFGVPSVPGKLSNIHGYNIPNEISSEPFLQNSQFLSSFALLCLFPERSDSSLLLFRSRPLLPNSRFNEIAQVVNRKEPLNPSVYHQVEAQPQLQNSALFTRKEGSMCDLIHIKKDDYHKPVSMENLPRFDKPSMPTALSSNARVIKRN